MKRIVDYSEEELARLGGKVGPSEPGKPNGANRKVEPVTVPILQPRTNHLPKRRELFAQQRQPEA